MAWWVWLLIGWAALAVLGGVIWGRALANADRRDRERRAREVEKKRQDPPAA